MTHTTVRRANILPHHRIVACTTALALAFMACESPDPDGAGATVVDEPAIAAAEPADDLADALADAPEPDPLEEPDRAAPGTRENPVPAGTTVRVGDWEVSVGPSDLDAGRRVMDENEFNELAEGRRAVIAEVTATYVGDDSGTTMVDLSWSFLGSGGNTFGMDMADHCGVIPGDLDHTGETFPGGSVTGNVCYQVPDDQIDGGAWMVEVLFSFDGGDRTFFALA